MLCLNLQFPNALSFTESGILSFGKTAVVVEVKCKISSGPIWRKDGTRENKLVRLNNELSFIKDFDTTMNGILR